MANNIYKPGDKVKVLKSDWPNEINVDSVQTILRNSIIGDGVYLSHLSDEFYFGLHEVEPYKEEVNNMNKYNLQVGDVINTPFNIGGDETITKIDAAKGDLWLSGSGWWSIRFTNEHVDKGKWKIVSQVSKMNNKIEVGDTVEFNRRTHIVTRLGKEEPDGGVKIYYNIDNDKEDWGYSSYYTLVSKAKQNMKEVIGYNIKSEYQSEVEIIAKTLSTHSRNVTLGAGQQVWMPAEGVADKAKKLGVLDLWFEPVYKSSEVVVSLSKSRIATITSKTICTITLADVSKFLVHSDAISRVLTSLNGLASIAGYKPKFKEFELGCQTFTINDLQAVDKAFKDFQ